jgi:hypothetical protein
MTVHSFQREIAIAVKAYDKYVVCIDRTPEDFEASLTSLLAKAIKAYETRGEGLRHGIALDKQNRHLEPRRRGAAVVWHLFQPPLALPEKYAAENREAAHGEIIEVGKLNFYPQLTGRALRRRFAHHR